MKSISSIARRCGFTLVELLVVIAIIGILTAFLLPALASAKRHAIITVCQSNFHQVSVACFVYANDYRDYFPICQSGASNTNYGNGFNINSDILYSGIGNPVSSSFVVMNPAGMPPNPANMPVKPGFQNLVFDCLGYLYETKLIGNGKILYCPGLPSSSLFSPGRYSNPNFMSTDSYGEIIDTMLFNPEIDDSLCTNALPYASPRLFRRTSNLIPGRLFGMDAVQTATNQYVQSGFGLNAFAHYPSHGFNVLFTDGSARFVQNRLAADIVMYNVPGDNGFLPPPFVYGIQSRPLYDLLFSFLEDRYPPTSWAWDYGGHYP